MKSCTEADSTISPYFLHLMAFSIIMNRSHKSVQSLHTFPDEKPEVYNRTSTSGGKVFSRLPQPVTSTTRNIEHGSHNPITNRITRLRSNIEHGRRSPLVISKRRGQCDGTVFTPPVQTCPAGSRRPVPAGRGTAHRLPSRSRSPPPPSRS